MENNEAIIKNVNIQQFTEDGSRIYEEIKSQYESQHSGEFLAIEVETRKVYLGRTTSDAVEEARKTHPDKVFYVVKIGSSASEVLAELAAAV